MTRETRFELYFFSVLSVLCIGSGVYFAFHLSWNRTLLPIALPSLPLPEPSVRGGSRSDRFQVTGGSSTVWTPLQLRPYPLFRLQRVNRDLDEKTVGFLWGLLAL
jgi:hypothetical protein